MPINATDPTVIPPAASATYDLWWVYRLTLDGSDPGNVQALVTLRKYCLAADGVTVQFSPLPSDTVVFQLVQIMALATGAIAPSNLGLSAASATAIGQAMAAILAGVESCGQDLNLL